MPDWRHLNKTAGTGFPKFGLWMDQAVEDAADVGIHGMTTWLLAEDPGTVTQLVALKPSPGPFVCASSLSQNNPPAKWILTSRRLAGDAR